MSSNGVAAISSQQSSNGVVLPSAINVIRNISNICFVLSYQEWWKISQVWAEWALGCPDLLWGWKNSHWTLTNLFPFEFESTKEEKNQRKDDSIVYFSDKKSAFTVRYPFVRINYHLCQQFDKKGERITFAQTWQTSSSYTEGTSSANQLVELHGRSILERETDLKLLCLLLLPRAQLLKEGQISGRGGRGRLPR